MPLSNDLQSFVTAVFTGTWTTRKGQKVPSTEDIGLANTAVELEGTVLYADLAESTQMVANRSPRFAAEVYKSYLYTAATIIRANKGSITAYDGDRVMAVFLGDAKNSQAVKSALQIKWAVDRILKPAIEKQYPSRDYVLKQKVGIDTSNLFVARTGIRGNNDLVWVGTAANNAAKMAALSPSYSTYISSSVLNAMNEKWRIGSNGEEMWHPLGSGALGYPVYGSTWRLDF